MTSAAELIKNRKKVGENIRRLRQEQGYSQEGFAHECGLHRNYLGGVERGERNVGMDNLYKITKALKCSHSDLMD